MYRFQNLINVFAIFTKVMKAQNYNNSICKYSTTETRRRILIKIRGKMILHYLSQTASNTILNDKFSIIEN